MAGSCSLIPICDCDPVVITVGRNHDLNYDPIITATLTVT